MDEEVKRMPGDHFQLSAAVLELRHLLGLSQQRFAFRLGDCTLLTVQRWEAGKSLPGYASLAKLSKLARRSRRPDLAVLFGSDAKVLTTASQAMECLRWKRIEAYSVRGQYRELIESGVSLDSYIPEESTAVDFRPVRKDEWFLSLDGHVLQSTRDDLDGKPLLVFTKEGR